MTERFWADVFDMDLPRVLPDLDKLLGDTADVRLWTYGGTSHGRINHPSMWNSEYGMTAYFGLDDSGDWKPVGYITGGDMVECTWREVVRDVWVHQCLVLVNLHPVLNTTRLEREFWGLMDHRRGIRVQPSLQVLDMVKAVATEVWAASQRLHNLVEQRRANNPSTMRPESRRQTSDHGKREASNG